jgi:integrase
MARSARDSKLDSRSARSSLKRGKRRFLAIGKGLTLVYRRTGEGFGTWSVKMAQPGGKYALNALGAADDQQDANGVDILDFYQAQEKARGLANEAKENAGILIKPKTVREAAEHYLKWYREHRRAVKETEHAISAHILPALGDRQLGALKAPHIREWLDQLATRPARLRASRFAKAPKYRAAPKTDEEKRARRASANRILNVLKAILNKAFHDNLIRDDTEWRTVKSFRNVDEPEIRYLEDAEAIRLINACPADLRTLVRAALLTGARFGELIAMSVRDVKIREEKVYIARSKGGRPRLVPLNEEGLALFKSLRTGKTGDALVFEQKDGRAWGKNHHVRALRAACDVAKIRPAISFHDLRHTYASMLINAGVGLPEISKLLGHADMRITLKHYAKLADKTLAAAVTKLPSLNDARREVVTAVPAGGS